MSVTAPAYVMPTANYQQVEPRSPRTQNVEVKDWDAGAPGTRMVTRKIYEGTGGRAPRRESDPSSPRSLLRVKASSSSASSSACAPRPGSVYVLESFPNGDRVCAVAADSVPPAVPKPEKQIQWASVPPSLSVPKGVSVIPLTEHSPRGSCRTKAFPLAKTIKSPTWLYSWFC